MHEDTPPTVGPLPTAKPAHGGRVAGKYDVIRLLGRGGMGVVYEAIDSVLMRRVALKVLPGAALVGPGAEQMFLDEARAAARLRHPSVVTVHDAGRHAADFYLAMELVEGGSAQDALAVGPMPPGRALAVIADVCRALAAAHAAGLIHRDVKPANILLPADGPAKLGDFGLAVPRLADGGLATQKGNTAGTPAFMSPEQFRGERLGPASDLYSLGATLYALLTCRPPFSADNLCAYMEAHLRAPLPDLSALPAGDVIRRAMAKSPADRFATAEEMLHAIEAAAGVGPTVPTPPLAAPRRLWPWIAAAAVVALVVTAIAWPRKPGLSPRPPGGEPTVLRPAASSAAGGPVLALAASPIDEGVLAWSLDRGRRGELLVGRPGGKVFGPVEKTQPIGYVAICRDGSAVAEYAGGLRFWDSRTGAQQDDKGTRGNADDRGVVCTAMHPLGHFAVFSARGRTPRLPRWDCRTSGYSDLGGITSRAACLAFSPDGARLVSAHDDRRLLWWPDEGGKPNASDPLSAVPRHLSIIPGDPPVAAAAVGDAVEFWHRGKGWLRATEKRPGGHGPLAASPDGRWLAACAGDEITLFDAGDGKTRATLRGHEAAVTAPAFTPAGRLVSGGRDSRLLFWDIPAP